MATQQEPAATARGGSTMTQFVRFGVIGAVSALAYFGLYLALRELTGPLAANVVALVSTQIANTAVNRRLTFGVRGRDRFLRHQAGGLAAFAFGLALSSGALWALHHLRPDSGRGAEVAVLIVAQAIATAVRFLTLRQMMRQHPS